MILNFAVLGAGRIGQVHADAIAAVPGARLAAVSDPVPEAADAIRDKYGCDVLSMDDIVAATDIDAVLICTPTDTHAELIETFVIAGKAVFCEKPVDLSIDRVKRCLATVANVGGTLMVGFQRRFDPDFRALKAEVDAGRIGTVEMVTLTSRDPGPPPYSYIERSGGIFRDMTIHDFDMARWLLGEEVKTVIAAATVQVDAKIGELGDYDSANVILTTASGKHCTITNTRRASYGYDQRVEVHGAGGAVSAENHRAARIEVATASGYTRPPLLDFFMSRYMSAYAAEIAAFVGTITQGEPVSPTGQDGLMALVLAEAALISVREGRAVEVSEVLD